MTKEKKTFQPLTSKDVCLVYDVLHREGVVSFAGNKDARNKVESIVSNINSNYFDQERYPTPELKVAAYLYFIIKSHPFIDGNKRTAVIVFQVLCAINTLKANDTIPLDAVAVFIEQTDSKDYQNIIESLAKLLFPHL